MILMLKKTADLGDEGTPNGACLIHIYPVSSSDHNMSDLANLIGVRGLELGTIALEVISPLSPGWQHNHHPPRLKVFTSQNWIQNNAASEFQTS